MKIAGAAILLWLTIDHFVAPALARAVRRRARKRRAA